ncbi:unnamed protein product [Camellia sinensis]
MVLMDSSNNDMTEHEPARPYTTTEGYALTGKVMLSAILILFAVVIFLICLHIYARFYLLRSRRRQLRRRNHLIFTLEPNSLTVTSASGGLDAIILSSLPVFVYSAETHPESLECAVCLSEFQENEKGRLLPKCNHSFHIDCIDMWFHSHSTCPLCRSPADPLPENKPDVVVSVGDDEPAEIEPGSSSGFCPMCNREEGESMGSSSTSLGDRRKVVGVEIEVPRRTESEDELGPSSPASQGWKSPATRLLSLKRIIGMNRKGSAVSPSSGMVGTSEDIECGGRDELTQQRSRVQTPR